MNECNIVQDLLPLYADDLASEDSVEFIDRHAENCPKCREIWRRYKGELPITHPPVSEDYKAPLRRDMMKMALSVLGTFLLVGCLLVFIVYYGWETGYYPVTAQYASPNGIRGVELIDWETEGYFQNQEGTILRILRHGNFSRYWTPWENVVVHWSPDSDKALLTMENRAGEPEIRIVDMLVWDTAGGGSLEIPGLLPKEEAPDLTHVMTELCKAHPEFPKDWETIIFTFSLWGSDSETVSFGFTTDSGETGFLDYHYPSGIITRVYHRQ